ncbi:MAG: hypothetical protein HYZ34_15160 [Ignavibacteriae bacterium]|nr:hypothetical protein [Ignavibacteriota bacterium]
MKETQTLTKYLFYIIAILFVVASTSIAQPELWEVYTNSNQPFINVVIDKYESDSVYMKSMNFEIVLHQDSIQYLIMRRESHFGLGFVGGAVVGGILMNVISEKSDNPLANLFRSDETVIGMLGGGMLGGIIGAAGGQDKKFEFRKLDTEEKRELLKRLF